MSSTFDRLPVLLLGIVVLGGALETAVVALSREPEEPPLTAIEAGPLGRATLVLLADIETVRSVRGMVLVGVRPVRAIKGERPASKTVTILIPGVRPTADQERPSAPYLGEEARGRYVFFLVPAQGGVAWRMETLFDTTGKVGKEKLASLERSAALTALPDYEERARQTLEWLLESQRAAGTWTRVNAARELNHLLEVRRDLFDDSVRSRIRLLSSRGCVPAQRRLLVRILRDLGATPPPPSTSPTPPAQADALAEALAGAKDPDARVAVMESYLHGGDPTAATALLGRIRDESVPVRAWMVRTFAEGGYRTLLPSIRGLYAYESEALVRGAIVHATGLLGSDADVAWLEERTLSAPVLREALFALARIRSPAALEALGRAGDRASEGGAADDIPALLDYLRSRAFVEVEASAGRAVGDARGR